MASALLGPGIAEKGYGLFNANSPDFSKVPGGAPAASYGYTLTYPAYVGFLYNQPGIPPADYTPVYPAYWFGDAPGDYRTYLRTDWSTSATQVTYTGGSIVAAGHQMHNGGHVYVQRGADRLLVNAGQRRGTAGVEGQPSAFSTAGWTLNELYLNDSTIIPLGHSGAGSTYCSTSSATIGCQSNNQNTGSAPMAHKETAGYVYSKTDLHLAYSNAISSPPLTTYYRSFASIGGVSFVYDYTVAVNYTTALRKQFWHTPALTTANPAGIASNIAVSGNIASMTVGSSTIWIKSLLPVTTVVTSVPDLKSYSSGTQQTSQHFEISDPAQSASPITAYLTVLAPTDSFVASMPSTSLISPSGFQGALYDDGTLGRVVLFSADGTALSSCAYTIDALAASVRHVIADLAPGTYSVRKHGHTIGAPIVVGEDGTLTFDSNGGGGFSVTLVSPYPPRIHPPVAKERSPNIW
jgi:hypothetical protein